MKNYGCELLNLIGTVGKVELISTFTTAVCESWNVSDKYTWDNAGDLKSGLHTVVMVISTVANMFLTLFQTVILIL